MSLIYKHILAIVLLFFTLAELSAQTLDETYKTLNLDSVTVQGWRRNSGIKKDLSGAMIWDMKILDVMPKILGNADPIHYAQMLPNIQTSSEYDSGIYIEGCENQHNNISIGGVTMYNVSHLMGFFSLFNASHYPSMEIRKAVMDSGDSNRLGGALNMELPDSVQNKFNGEFSLGFISSQGTFRIPLTKESSLFLSLRTSYLNLLYSHWMEVDGSTFRYSFSDANITYLYKPSERNTFWIDGYYGYDNARAELLEFGGSAKLKWGNRMLAAHYKHQYDNGSEIEHTLYTTGTQNDLNLDFSVVNLKLPSLLTDVGYKTQWRSRRWLLGGETIYHHIKPQFPSFEESFNNIQNEQQIIDSHENSLYANYTQPLFGNLSLTGGLRGVVYIKDMSRYFRKTYSALDPNVSLRYRNSKLNCSLGYNMRHQMLFQTGLSTVNMPTEFWMGATDDVPPQYGHCFTFMSDLSFADGDWSVSAEVYYKKLFNQIEYCGSPIDLITKPYDLSSSLYHGRGYNYGFSVMLNKHRGRLNGWMSYSYGRARRQFAEYGYEGWFSALHERPHEFNVVASYSLSKRLNLGATFIAASGTPFTASRSFYIYNGNIVIEKGEHNANRLNPYIRLDLSLDYKLKSRIFKESGLNFSLYNSQIRANDLAYYVKTYNDTFSYKPVTFLLPLLPSISYYAKF